MSERNMTDRELGFAADQIYTCYVIQGKRTFVINKDRFNATPIYDEHLNEFEFLEKMKNWNANPNLHKRF